MRSVRKYTKEFKQEAVKLALQKPSVTQAAKDLGVPSPTLHSWIYAMKGTQLSNSPDAKSTPVDVSALLEENRRLHKENIVLKEEKEILKKAATYFAQHQK